MLIISDKLTLANVSAPYPGTPLIGWKSIITTTNILATSQVAGSPASNLVHPSTVESWQAADASEQFLGVAVSEADQVQYLAVAAHNFGSAAIPVSVQGRVATGGDPPEEWVELTTPMIPANDGPLLFWFGDQNVSSVRLRMQVGSAAAVASVLFIGPLLVMERGLRADRPFGQVTMSRKREFVADRSEAGDFVGRIVTGSYIELPADFAQLSPHWYRANFDPFVDAAAVRPFFYVPDPLNRPAEVGYMYLTADPIPVEDTSTRRLEVSLQMRGVVL